MVIFLDRKSSAHGKKGGDDQGADRRPGPCMVIFPGAGGFSRWQ